MSELASDATDYSVVEREPSDVIAENLKAAARLWSSATVFFFFAFLFAYFYLRSLNQEHLWKPKGVHPPQGLGAAIVACLVAAAVLLHWAAVDQRSDRRPAWRLKGALALALGLAAIVLQVVAWTRLGFGPTDGGFASVYVGWTGLSLLFLLATLYWLETTLAVSFRYRAHSMAAPVPVEAGHAAGDAYREGQDIEDPVAVNVAELAGLTEYWTVLAAVGVISWIVLYLL
ncbi:MAG TPA: cytochrome c oxidase subunit 3 [Gaiellaceae bacterium]|nr:cytochrome c oxidase subunit 3 [Gaiellaceae bacterium]